MGSTERLHIRWNDFESNIKLGLSELRQEKELFDVTLACGSKQIKAHKVILSACSPFFRSIIKSVPHEHPLLYLRGVQFHHLESLLAFIYNGEVNVTQEELDSFLAVAEELKIKGLAHNEAFISSLSVPESHPPPNKRPRNEDQGISPEPSITGLCISAYSLKTHSSLVISKETSPNPSKFPPQKEQDIPIGEDDDEIEDVTIVKEEDKYVFESNNDEVGLDNQSQELENELHDVKYIEDHIDFESESEELCCDTLRDSENTSHPDLNKVSALKNKVFISHPNQGIYNQSSLYDFNNTFEGNTPKRNLLPCAVSICYSPHVNSGEGYSYHRFPKAKDIRVKWITACHRQDPFNPETARVCSRHFEKDCFQRNLKAELMSNYGRTSSSKVRKTLRSNAVPTLYLVPESSIRAAEIEESNVERTKRLSSRNTKQIVNEVLTTPKQAV